MCKPCNPKGFIEIPLTLWLTLLKQRFRSSQLCYVIDGIKCKGNASYTLPNGSALKRLKLEAYVTFWKFSTVLPNVQRLTKVFQHLLYTIHNLYVAIRVVDVLQETF